MAEAPAEISLSPEGLSAYVVGYTGEVGKEVVKELARCDAFSKVTLIGRRTVEFDDPELMKKMEQKVIDFEKPEESADAFKADVGFCCLGTTRGKSGSSGFYKVDHDYVMNTAKVAKNAGCKHFSLCSSQGANKNSWFLYMKTKGQVEEELKALEFTHLDIFQPGFLECDRKESRAGEKVLGTVMKPFLKAFPNTMSISTATVAKAMVHMTISPERAKGDKWKIFNMKEMAAAAAAQDKK